MFMCRAATSWHFLRGKWLQLAPNNWKTHWRFHDVFEKFVGAIARVITPWLQACACALQNKIGSTLTVLTTFWYIYFQSPNRSRHFRPDASYRCSNQTRQPSAKQTMSSRVSVRLLGVSMQQLNVLLLTSVIFCVSYNRLQRIRSLRWEFGSVLPPEIKGNLSEREVNN